MDDNIQVVRGLNYGDTTSEYQQFDICFRDDNLPKPLIIWLHGGGFVGGAKENIQTQLWCKEFARMGYVSVALNYTIHPEKQINTPFLRKSCDIAMQDVVTAVDFFEKNAGDYFININKIILAGNSAGGFLALHCGYNSASTLKAKVCGIVNLWGAVFNLDDLKNNDIPIVSVHGNNDNIVPFDAARGIYGSLPIREKANELGIENALKVYSNYSHELQEVFNPPHYDEGTKQRWKESAIFVNDFLTEKILKN